MGQKTLRTGIRYAISLCMAMVIGLESFAMQDSLSVNIQGKGITIAQIFKSLRQQTGYIVFYNNKMLNDQEQLDVQFVHAGVTKVMDVVCKGRGITYVIRDRLILLRKNGSAAAVPDAAGPAARGATPMLQSQDTTISGTVRDPDGQPLVGVAIRLKDSPKGTVTNAEGHYLLSVPNLQGVLLFSYVGYESREVPVHGREGVDVVLTEGVAALSQLVVVGYGSQKKENVTSAISTLDMSTKAGQPITNVSNAMYGMSGLYVNLINSMPGVDRAQIRVRGIGDLNSTGSDPLVLVDGIEYPLNEINPNDIASITVLKDASAAIYGSKAANGVVLVTTKKGQGEASVHYSYYYGMQQPTFMPDAIWDPIEYMKLFNQAERNEGKQTVTFSDQQIHEYEVGMHLDPYTYPANNWFDKVLQNGSIQKHDLSVSKSTDTYRYRASIGFLNRDGIFIGDGNKEKKYYYGLNSSVKIGERLDVGLNINGNYRSYTQPSYSTSTFLNALMRSLPVMPDTLQNGTWGYTWLRVPGRNSWENPLMYLSEGNFTKTQLRTVASVSADYRLPFSLTYKVKFGVDKYDAFQERFIPQMVKYQVKTGEQQVHSSAAPQSYNYDWNNIDIHFYNTLNWVHAFQKGHNLSAMVGASYDNYAAISFDAQMRGYSDNTLVALDAGTAPYAINGHGTRDVLESYFGRVNYDYKGKYLLQGIFRFDGSSRFAPGHRWGFFPGLSAGWRLDREAFAQDLDFIDLLKLRASVGQSGNQAVALYSYENDVTLGHDYSFGGTNGTLFSGAASTALADPTTSWEITTNYDLGLDVALWKNRLGLTIDVYQKWTSGLLRTVDIPDQVGGLSGPKMNVGTISNKGYEVDLNYNNNLGRFSYRIYGSVSYNRNTVEDLDGEIIYNNSNSGLSTITREGYPVSSFYVLQTEGIFQSDEEVADHAVQSGNTRAGYLKYRDVNGDDIVNDEDRVNLAVSAVTPKYNYGFGFTLGYEGISLSANFQGVGGYYVMPAANLAFPFNNGAGVTWEWATDSWTPERPHARLPIVTEANYGDKENFKPSDFWLKNASYLRLKNVQLAYEIPQSILSRIKIKALTVFINAENWLTFTHFKESDPEGIYNAGSLYHYPMLKTINGGLNVTF